MVTISIRLLLRNPLKSLLEKTMVNTMRVRLKTP